MKYCPNTRCPDRERTGQPIAYGDDMEACPTCSFGLTSDDPALPQPPLPWKKLCVTLGILAVCLFARNIDLPNIKVNPSAEVGFSAGTNIMALGVRPLVMGYILVELVALLIPVLRPLRVGGPEGRAKLHRASLFVGMFLAFGQALVLALGLQKFGLAQSSGAGFRLVIVLTLLGATAVLVVLARIVERHGLGSGLGILLLAEAIPYIVPPLWRAGPTAPGFTEAFFVLIVAGATLWMFGPYSLPGIDASAHPARVSRPACGLTPLTLVPTLLIFGTRLNGRPGHLSEVFSSNPVLALSLSGVAAVFFAFLFNQPEYIARAWKRLAPNSPLGVPSLKLAMVESVLFVVAVMLAEIWVLKRVEHSYIPSFLAVILATGIVVDIVREWRAIRLHRDLTTIWEIHQTYAVAPTLELLEAEGIPAFAKGRHARSLFQFFGPHIPIQILVPGEQARQARAVLEARWFDLKAPTRPSQGGASGETPARRMEPLGA